MAPHEWLHEPQLSRSLWRFVQTADPPEPQSVAPIAHAHVPFEQLCTDGHARPQPPQLL